MVHFSRGRKILRQRRNGRVDIGCDAGGIGALFRQILQECALRCLFWGFFFEIENRMKNWTSNTNRIAVMTE